ncbi:MAG: ABC-type siderophore export system fused ATPase/permease subunit [Francisellaceae bacterium]
MFEHILNRSGDLVKKSDVQGHLERLKMANKVDVVDGKLTMTTLSQGQRKRLAMLLAYGEDAAIYLFDEWAADQDPYFRDYFYRELLPELKSKGKTVVVISHDDRYFHLADRLYKFDSGQAMMESSYDTQESYA